MRLSALGGCVLACAFFVGCQSDTPGDSTAFEDVGLVGVENADGMSRELADMREATEEAAACMRSEGFTFVPWASAELVIDGLVEAPPVGTEEFAAQRGYGVLSGFSDSIRTHPSAKQDPNQVLLDGMTDQERFVYMQSLQGFDGGGAIVAGVDEDLYNEGGCLGRAMRARGMFERTELLGELVGPYEELEARVNSDERLVDYDREWSTCMTDQGFAFESSPAASDHFRMRFRELWGTVTFPADAFTLEQLRDMSAGEREQLYRQDPIYDDNLLGEWRREEVATAVADLECQGSSRREKIFIEVLAEFEDEFLDEYAPVVEQLNEVQG